ncbi:MAG: hypothetical protein Q9176_004549 [Flavoplaca citrina]
MDPRLGQGLPPACGDPFTTAAATPGHPFHQVAQQHHIPPHAMREFLRAMQQFDYDNGRPFRYDPLMALVEQEVAAGLYGDATAYWEGFGPGGQHGGHGGHGGRGHRHGAHGAHGGPHHRHGAHGGPGHRHGGHGGPAGHAGRGRRGGHEEHDWTQDFSDVDDFMNLTYSDDSWEGPSDEDLDDMVRELQANHPSGTWGQNGLDGGTWGHDGLDGSGMGGGSRHGGHGRRHGGGRGRHGGHGGMGMGGGRF